MSLGIWDALGNVPFVGSVKRGVDATASALGLNGSVNVNPESTYSPKAPEPQPSPEWKEHAPEDPEPQPENNSGGNPLTDWIPGWDKSKGVWENFTGGVADNTVELIPGWDSSKGVTANITGGIKDVFTNAGKAAAELGSAFTGSVKKYLPLAAAGAVALLLLKK